MWEHKYEQGLASTLESISVVCPYVFVSFVHICEFYVCVCVCFVCVTGVSGVNTALPETIKEQSSPFRP